MKNGDYRCYVKECEYKSSTNKQKCGLGALPDGGKEYDACMGTFRYQITNTASYNTSKKH